MKRLLPVLGVLVWATHACLAGGPGGVTVSRVPDGGLQPQVVRDKGGTVHLLYFKGEAAAGDLFYAARKAGQTDFGAPVRVNSLPGSAVATGTIRGGQIALGPDGRVHVAWNGSRTAAASSDQGHPQSPMLYARLEAGGGRFEDQRNLMTSTRLLDGGGTVAADPAGGVWVTWHAAAGEGENDEASRRVWVARSTDGGASFLPERAVDPGDGACACCGMGSRATPDGRLYLFYRTAKGGTDRGMRLLVSDGAGGFVAVAADGWRIGTCPMSSCSLEAVPGGVLVAGETAGQAWFARYDAASGTLGGRVTAPGQSTSRKHARAIPGADGTTLLIWAEGTGWNRGGAVVWQVYDAQGEPIEGSLGRAEGLPAWSFAAGAPIPGGFEIWY